MGKIDFDKVHFSTKAIHAAQEPDPAWGALSTPIYMTSTFCFDDLEGYLNVKRTGEGYTYTRSGNPTTRTLEEKLAALECGEDCVVTASGMGAISGTLLTLLSSGDHVVCGRAVYGTTNELLREYLSKFGVKYTFANGANLDEVRAAIAPETKVLYFETPANPNLTVTDIAAVAEIAHKNGALLVVDNTFAPPPIQFPLTLGADVVVHSLTKYLNGHGDAVGGAVISKKTLIDKIRFEAVRGICGNPPAPMNSYFVLRGIKTLDLRVRRHCANALALAEYLEQHEYIEKVFYPGLERAEGHELAKRQMNGLYTGMVSFVLRESIHGLSALEAGRALMGYLQIPRLAVSLGDPDSLIEQPASMTHRLIPKIDREAAGIADGLMRYSVGLEDQEDILTDMKQALAAL